MDILPVCAEPLTLSETQIRTLQARPDAANEIEPIVDCELQDGHPGPHLALGQSYGTAAEVWLRWQDGQPPELVEVPEPGFCTAEGPDLDDPGELRQCCLPAEHPGAHSFQMQESGGRTPSPENQRRLAEALRQIGTPGQEADG